MSLWRSLPFYWQELKSRMGLHSGQRPCDRQWRPVRNRGEGGRGGGIQPSLPVQTQKEPEEKVLEANSCQRGPAVPVRRPGQGRTRWGPGVEGWRRPPTVSNMEGPRKVGSSCWDPTPCSNHSAQGCRAPEGPAQDTCPALRVFLSVKYLRPSICCWLKTHPRTPTGS